MHKLSFAILDDQKDLLSIYETMIEKILKKNQITGSIVSCTNNISEFMEAVFSGKVNVCFLDISLGANENGLSIAHKIRENGFKEVEILFITGHAQFMQDAFFVKPFYYILKPITEELLEKEILRLEKAFSNKGSDSEYLNLNTKSIGYPLKKNDIVFVEHNGFKTVIHSLYSTIELYIPLHEVVEQLPSENFIQSHRSIFTNINFVSQIDYKNGSIFLNTGEKCILSRSFKDKWRNANGNK